MTYVRALKFKERPDYNHMRRIFKELFVREGFEYDNAFDWKRHNYQKKNLTSIFGAKPEQEEKKLEILETNFATQGELTLMTQGDGDRSKQEIEQEEQKAK